MTYEEIIKIESDRSEASKFNVVHLIREGNFYRAHDWSAWLMTNFKPYNGDELSLACRAKRKDNKVYAWVGFPLTSLNKYVDQSLTLSFTPISDVQIDFALNIPNELMSESAETLREMVDTWKESLPINDDKKTKKEAQEARGAAHNFTRMSDIIRDILSFPLENKTPRDAYDFLSELRREAIKLY